MRIAFLLGYPDINGGTYVIYEHAHRLHQRGHEVCLVTKETISPERYAWHPGASLVDWQTFDSAADKEFDYVIATWWLSAFDLKRLKAERYIYFIQSIESRFMPPEDPSQLDLRSIDVMRALCENTYLLSLPIITEANWIKQYLIDHYNHHAEIVRNGIRKDIYKNSGYCVAPRDEGQLRILIEGPFGVFYKNTEKTIEICRKSEANEIWVLTPSDRQSYPGIDRCFSRVPIIDTPSIYRSCDVIVKLSYVEGMFGPPLEMFHCGGTAIVYNVTGHDEYIEHKVNGIVVERDQEDTVIDYINQLKCDPEMLVQLKEGAVNTANKWPDWESSSKKFEDVLEKFKAGPFSSQKYLSSFTRRLDQFHENDFKANELNRFIEREKETYTDERRIDNFVQVYWHKGEGFSGENMVWERYEANKWQVINIEIPNESSPVQLRLDPSVRIGVVAIRSIRIRCARTEKLIATYEYSNQFQGIKVSGTAIRLTDNPFIILECYGEDPQIFFPSNVLTTDGIVPLIEIDLLETSFREMFNILSISPDELYDKLNGFSLRPDKQKSSSNKQFNPFQNIIKRFKNAIFRNCEKQL